jgi:hypothetical protein
MTKDPYKRRVLRVDRGDSSFLSVQFSFSEEDLSRKPLIPDPIWIVGYDPINHIYNPYGSPIGPREFLAAWEEYRTSKVIKVRGEFKLLKV